MNFPQAIQSGFQNYVNFNGRASRSAYWYWFLFGFLGGMITSILDSSTMHTDPSSMQHPINAIFVLITFLPGIAVAARRLHDTDRSAWWLLIMLIPLIGFIVLLVWFCSRGTEGPNQYGSDPLQTLS